MEDDWTRPSRNRKRCPMRWSVEALEWLAMYSMVSRTGVGQIFCDPQAVKLQPHIFPGVIFVRTVCVDLPRTNEKALICLQVIAVCHAIRSVCVQKPLSRDHIVKKEVVADERPKGVEGSTLLPAILI